MKNFNPVNNNNRVHFKGCLVICFFLVFSCMTSEVFGQCKRIRTVKFQLGYYYVPVASKYRLNKDSDYVDNDLFSAGEGAHLSFIFYPNDDAYTDLAGLIYFYDGSVSLSYINFKEELMKPSTYNMYVGGKYGWLYNRDKRFPLYVPFGVGGSYIQNAEENEIKLYIEAGVGLEIPVKGLALFCQCSYIFNNIEHVRYYPFLVGIKI